jgi:hypothetical protein
MPSYIRPHSEDRVYLRALMNSALSLLNTTSASQTVSQNRVGESRSDRSCHQLAHTSHRTVRHLNFFTLPVFFSVYSLWYPPDTRSILSPPHALSSRHHSPLCPSSLGLAGPLTIDLAPTQDRPHNARVFIRHRHRRPVPPPPFEDAPDPLTAAIRFGLRPPQGRPGSMDQ